MAVEEGIDYAKLGKELEDQEIESPGGVATPQVYGQLLAIYLLQNDMPNAKFLWKRIPASVKSANPELSQVWTVGQKLWNRDFPGIYEALNNDWPKHLKPIMDAVLAHTRERGFNLVGQAYSSIPGDQLAVFVGLPVTEAVEAVIARGWDADAQTRMIMPKKSKLVQEPCIPTEQQMARLTDFVAFLEN